MLNTSDFRTTAYLKYKNYNIRIKPSSSKLSFDPIFSFQKRYNVLNAYKLRDNFFITYHVNSVKTRRFC